MKKDYVPGTNSGFRSWANLILTQLNANGALWNVPAAIIGQLAIMVAQFETLYLSVENRRLRTTEQVITYDTYKAELTTFLRELVQNHLVRNPAIPYATKIAMNLNPRGNSSERPDIDSTPIIVLSNAARGSVRFKLLVKDMGKRPKIHPDANGAELRFYITDTRIPTEPAPPYDHNSETEGPAPTSTPLPILRGTVMQSFFTTRGSFERKLEQYIGKALVVQARWVNTTDDSKSSTWSEFTTIVIA